MLHYSPSLTGADRILHADGTITGEEHLDEWLSAWGLRLNALSARWYFRPLRPQLAALATECQHRAGEARAMRKMLDEIVGASHEEAVAAPMRALVELEALLIRWGR